MKKFIILMAILVPFGALATVLRTFEVEPDRPSNLAGLPLNFGGWKGEDYPVDQATAAILQATDVITRGYADSAGNGVGLYVGYFRDQKYGSQIHSPRHCLPGGGWVVANLQRIPFQLGPREITVNRMTIARRNQAQQMYYWFHTRSGDLTSEYALKFDLIRNSLLFSPTDAVIIRVTVPQGKRTLAECQQIAERFMQDLHQELQQSLPFASL